MYSGGLRAKSQVRYTLLSEGKNGDLVILGAKDASSAMIDLI
jgi:hypothetical protein